VTRNRMTSAPALAAAICAWAAAGCASLASLSVAGSVLAHDAAAAPQQGGQGQDPGPGHHPESPRILGDSVPRTGLAATGPRSIEDDTAISEEKNQIVAKITEEPGNGRYGISFHHLAAIYWVLKSSQRSSDWLALLKQSLSERRPVNFRHVVGWSQITSVELAAAAPAAPEKLAAPGVTLLTMLSNSGWTVVLYFADEGIREVFYRLDEASEFRSTGFTRMIDPKTGFPVPANFFQLPRDIGRTSRHTVAVRWIDATGAQKGPRELSLSLATEVIQSAKQTLETLTPNDWIAFREYPKGRLLVYFTHLLMHRNALREIRYSADDASLSRRLPFETWTDLSTTPTVGDPCYLELPFATRSVSVQLRYVDGSESEVKTFPVRLMP
jgi:hypothetical protein